MKWLRLPNGDLIQDRWVIGLCVAEGQDDNLWYVCVPSGVDGYGFDDRIAASAPYNTREEALVEQRRLAHLLAGTESAIGSHHTIIE